VCDVITFYSPEAVIMTSEDLTPQRGAMHESIASNVIFQCNCKQCHAFHRPCIYPCVHMMAVTCLRMLHLCHDGSQGGCCALWLGLWRIAAQLRNKLHTRALIHYNNLCHAAQVLVCSRGEGHLAPMGRAPHALPKLRTRWCERLCAVWMDGWMNGWMGRYTCMPSMMDVAQRIIIIFTLPA
jgi:hypothetical protein